MIGMSWGSANAQTKLVKPANGGTIKINKSGSYFLGGEFTFATAGCSSAIRIASGVNNVTINLNGFTILGSAAAALPMASMLPTIQALRLSTAP